MRFIALDFETASHRPDSVCQLGIAVFDDGRLIDQITQRVRPPRLYFSPRCIAIHGIRPQDVRDCPTWDAVWEEHQELFESYPIIAHNASFDLNVLCASLKAFGLECPYMEYSCSRLIAQRTWPGRSSYALKAAADALGVQFQHHDALEDARVCGQIVLAAAEAVGTQSLDGLERELAMQRGRVQFGVRIAPRGRPGPRSGRQTALTASPRFATMATILDAGSDALQSNQASTIEPADAATAAVKLAERLVDQCQSSRPLANKRLVLSGRLLGLDRATAVAFLQRLGGEVQRDINLQTNYVIVGTAETPVRTDVASSNCDPLSQRQIEEIERRRSEGQSIRILSQRQLLALLPGGAAAARAGLSG